MAGVFRTWRAAALLTTAALTACGPNDPPDFPRATIVVGNVDIIRKGTTVALEQQQVLRTGDTVRVNDKSKVKFELPAGAVWYLNRGSEFAMGPSVPLSGDKRRLAVTLASGRLHIVKRDDSFEEYLVTTPRQTVRVTAADITISAGGAAQECDIVLLAGFATFTPPGGTETVIPPCSRLSADGVGPGVIGPVRASDVASVKNWVGSTVIDEAVARAGCTADEEQSVNEPPRWVRMLRETASKMEPYVDTVAAIDPEQGTVTYRLCKAPAGMDLDTAQGIVSYTPPVAGNDTLTIVATDDRALSCTSTVVISISAGLSVVLTAPRITEPGKPVSVSAAVRGIRKKRVMYRFDLNGDGKFDVPAGGKFAPKSVVSKHVFPNEGVVKVVVEARSDDGQTAVAKRLVVVNSPPAAALSVTPQLATTGTPVEFDVSASSDTRNGAAPLKVRFDVDGNGIWDLPDRNEFLTVKRVTYAWDKPGTYRIVAELTDKDGASGTASAQVVISRGITGGVIKCPDTVNVGDSVNIVVQPPSTEFPIREYAWSFDGDSVYEKKNGHPSARTAFGKAGTVHIRCSMTDEKGQTGVVVRKLTVINSASDVDAGGPYRGGVNKEIAFTGKAKDRDSRITGYSWDFNGDDTADWTSKTDMSTTYTFRKSGIYSARFTVGTDDGNKASDSARVEIINKAPTASGGDDVVSRKNRKVRLKGTGADEDGNLSLYGWDFDGNGVIDWTSKETGTVEHEFTDYTKAIFRVYDTDGDSASDTVTIIICPEAMRTIESSKFCIDAYESPNRKNTAPQVDVAYADAQSICRKAGKHLCSAAEWEAACRDVNKNYDYPYSTRYSADKCNTLGNPRLKNSIAPSGDFFECKNSAEVFDMSGNVAEWVESGSGDPYVYGGSYQSGEQESGCGSKMQLKNGIKYFYVGFRCCK